MNRWFKIEWFDGRTWQCIDDNIVHVNDAKKCAKDNAIDQPNTVVKISDNEGDRIAAYKYSYQVMYRWRDNGWVVDAL